jgi:hypothetical protein
VIFAPTRSRYTYRRLVDHEELTSLLASSPIVDHPGGSESVGLRRERFEQWRIV